MTTFLYLCIVGEMIFVNLTTIHLCTPKKYSTSKIIAALLAFTFALVALLISGYSKLPNYGNGNGMFVLAGFFYLLPLKFLYKERLIYILEVLCSSWIYTMLAFMLSVHTAKLFSQELFPIVTFSVQTIFYLSTVFFFWGFIRKKFVYTLQNIPSNTRKYLRYGSILWFLAMVAVNMSFVSAYSSVAKICALVFIGVIAWVSYSLIYEVTKSNHSAEQMKQIAMTDYLTKLPNRYSLWSDAEEYIEKKTPFFAVYMDLNDFKSVNDKYGHLAGDTYLSLFAENTRKAVGDMGTLYRISGDEFLLLCPNPHIALSELELAVRSISFNNLQFGEFLGVSMGAASYPEDGDSFDRVLAVADTGMYKDKRKKRKVKQDDSVKA